MIKESYTDTSSNGQVVGAIGLVPQVVGCHCYVVLSSYMEDRYRREPIRYRKEVAVYDAVRTSGAVVAVVKPTIPLSCRWDLLPQWGEDAVAFHRQTIGPTITVVKLP